MLIVKNKCFVTNVTTFTTKAIQGVNWLKVSAWMLGTVLLLSVIAPQTHRKEVSSYEKSAIEVCASSTHL
jgi:hypothetical protein